MPPGLVETSSLAGRLDSFWVGTGGCPERAREDAGGTIIVRETELLRTRTETYPERGPMHDKARGPAASYSGPHYHPDGPSLHDWLSR